MALEDDLDTLYACPLGEFIDRRKALAQAVRKAGRKDDAAKIAAATKPTPAAWAVNQLAREARHLATAKEQAAEEARRKAEAAALAAGIAEDEAASAAREELAATAALEEAEKAVARAAAECIAAEEAIVRERRGAKGSPA